MAAVVRPIAVVLIVFITVAGVSFNRRAYSPRPPPPGIRPPGPPPASVAAKSPTSSPVPTRPPATLTPEARAKLLLASPLSSRIIVCTVCRALYCPIPKVASTNWKVHLREFDNVPDAHNLATLHDWDKNGLRRLFEFDSDQIAAFLHPKTGYFKFTFVRDPYTRVLSAYLNKFVDGHALIAKHGRGDYAGYLANLYSWSYIREHNIEEEDPPHFDEFLAAVENRTRRGAEDAAEMNEHWAPQARLCGLGGGEGMEYDFVGRFERYDEDAAVVLKRLGHGEARFLTQEDVKFPSVRTDERSGEHMDDAAREVIRRVYKEDFDLLEYPK